MRLPKWYRKRRALSQGFFWLPCPSCGKEFGGDEVLLSGENQCSIPTGPPGDISRGTLICPACTKAGIGDRAWAERGLIFFPGTEFPPSSYS